jgi:hypothetical protein
MGTLASIAAHVRLSNFSAYSHTSYIPCLSQHAAEMSCGIIYTAGGLDKYEVDKRRIGISSVSIIPE